MLKRLHILICFIFMLSLAMSPSHVMPQEQVPQPPAQDTEKPSTEPGAPKKSEEPPTPESGKLITPESGKMAPLSEQVKAEPQKEEGGAYTIKQGDTLWDISNAFFKDPFLWPLLWKANPYITNPDLIYPGNKLIIPSLAPIERAMEKPEEVALEEKGVEEKPAVTAPEREIAEAPVPVRKKPVKPEEPVEEEAPARPKLILPEEAAVPIMDKYTMLNAGFVNQEETDDRIIGSPEPKTIYGYDDVVYITIKSQPEANIGDRFLIYKPLKKVKHPDTGENYGRLIKVLGILVVTAKDSPDVPLTARITLSFDYSEKGSLLTPYQEPTLIYEPSQKRTKDVSGYILEVVDGRTINAQLDIVYLDKGSLDGVEQGDRFIVYIEQESSDYYSLPRKVLGEVQAFLVKEHTSTAVVRKSTDTLAKGDKIEFKK